jgi:hypothetical protein
MFNPFRKKRGCAAIKAGIDQFDKIATDILAGVEDNHAKVGSNEALMDALAAENHTLLNNAARGESVAAKMRALIS